MNRLLILDSVREILSKSGFDVSEEINERTICFDVIARRNDTLIIIKVLVNIDSFNKYSATELKVISNCLDGSPLVIGSHSSGGMIEDGAVYLRHGIPIMSPQTISEYFIDNSPPLIFAAPGGFFVHIDGKLLRNIREKRGISLGTLADAAGVSRRAVMMYEEGMSAMVDIAVKLQEYLEEPIIIPCDPLGKLTTAADVETYNQGQVPRSTRDEEILEHLKVLGYEVIPTRHSPFDAITGKQKVMILTGIEHPSKTLKSRARTIFNISQLAELYSVFFVQKNKFMPNIEGIPTIALDELMSIEDSNEIIELISERS